MLRWGLPLLEIGGGLIHPWRCSILPRWWHWLMARRNWLLAFGPTGADVPGQWHPWRWYPKVFLVGWRFWIWWPGCPKIWALAEYSAKARARGLWISLWIFSWGTGFFLEWNLLGWRHWLLDYGPTFACTVDDVDAKCVDTDALGGHVTRTANVIILPMGPMVSLPLPRSSQTTKRRAGLISHLYWSTRVVVQNSWLK